MRRLTGKSAVLVMMVAISATFPASATADDPVTAWADAAISVDGSDFRSAVGSATLRCSPDWCTGGTNVTGAAYSLSVVTDPDTANAATSAVPVQAATSEGDVVHSGSGYVRFILKAEVGGTAVGDTLVQDVSFGIRSAASSAVGYDNREGALQELVTAGMETSLIYSGEWAENPANLEISTVCVRHERNGTLIGVTTNSLLQAQCPADGMEPFATARLQWGEYRFLLREFASDGSTVLEYLSPEFAIPHVIGAKFIIR